MSSRNFYPLSLLDQNFGLCISLQDFLCPFLNLYGTNNYYRPWKWYMHQSMKDFGSTIYDNKDLFKITLDVQHFKPEEVSVKVTDSEVIIEGKHEERQDNHGFISRQFKRRYFLPRDCNPDTVVSSLSSDGVLSVTADKKIRLISKEIIIPIKMCESCPNKNDTKSKTETKLPADETKKEIIEANKNKTALMLKEDHCILLKPELLGEAAAAATEKISKQTKSELEDLFKATTASLEQQNDVKSKETIEEKCESTTAKIGIEQTAETSIASPASKSETANVTCMTSETVESSTFSSMSSSIKETTEKISEIVSDISAQLREAAENI